MEKPVEAIFKDGEIYTLVLTKNGVLINGKNEARREMVHSYLSYYTNKKFHNLKNEVLKLFNEYNFDYNKEERFKTDLIPICISYFAVCLNVEKEKFVENLNNSLNEYIFKNEFTFQ